MIGSKSTTVKKKNLKNAGTQGLAAAKSPDEKTRLDRDLQATDSEIDRLVYDLYGLTTED
jgi:hypothetical protein